MTYERSWPRILLHYSMCLVFVSAICALIAPAAVSASSSGWSLLLNVIMAVIAIGNVSIWIWGIVWIAMRRKSFRCSVTASTVDCQCPIPWFGRSFSVRIADLVSIRKEPTSGEGYRCVLVTKQGAEYDLTYWYGNPVDKIIAEIVRVCPSIERSEYGRKLRPLNSQPNG